MVFAPHPDDEALATSGIIKAARASGKTVKVVVATNGDCLVTSIGQTREQETVAAMALLGLAADDVIFLGYPDCGLATLYYNYTSPLSQFTSAAGHAQTYAFEGLGHTDYHSYLYGAPAPFNRPSLLADVKRVLLNYNPQDIYVTSAYDAHGDHSALNFFLTDALAELVRTTPAFQPTLHDALIHEPCELSCNPDPNAHWPLPTFTPGVPFSEPAYLSTTPLPWNGIESVTVPPEMLATPQSANLKFQAIARYASQGGSTDVWLEAFVKHNEVFWPWELWSNLALEATATASSALTNGVLISSPDRVNDGSVSGAPIKGDGEWAADHQLAGAWARLTWAAAQSVTSITLHDRPSPSDNITAGVLTFSDGSSIAVGALPANGGGLTVAFAQKQVTWAQFTVSSADGQSAGLAEFEVYGPAVSKQAWQPPAPNFAPAITNGPVASPSTISDAASSSITLTATDPDNDPLTYIWSVSSGQLTGSGSSVTFFPPAVAVSTAFRIDVTVADGRGGKTAGSVTVTANPSGRPLPIAGSAFATASTEDTPHGQGAAKAIDGIVSGYPDAPDKEWSTLGQQAGAWIQLTWNNAVSIGRIILHDRINLSDQILAGALVFSDGSTIPVASLPNDGTGLTLDFPSKTVTWVRLDVTSSRGESVGLAEFEVFAIPINQPPTVNTGADQTITLPSGATLSGTATDDGLPNPPGVLSVNWTQVSGTGTTTFASPSALTTAASFSASGTYVLRLSVTDGLLSVSDDVTIVVNPPPNRPPQVNAGVDQAIALPGGATLSGTATDDGLPDPPGALSVTWSKVSGPGTVTFTAPAALTTAATFSSAGTYIVRLSATDGASSASDDVTVVVNQRPNQPPVVTAGADQTITLPNGAALSGSATDDGLPAPPGALSASWSKVSGPGTVTFGARSSLTTAANFSTSGTYVVRLTVSDGAIAVSDDVTIVVNPQGLLGGLVGGVLHLLFH